MLRTIRGVDVVIINEAEARQLTEIPNLIKAAHTILSWGLEVDGRKRRAAAALYDSDGVLTCASRALWIELRQ